MTSLEEDTRLEGGEGGRYGARLSKNWEIWGPNGGYLAALVLRAAGKVARIPRPASLHVHYLRQARFDHVDIQVNSLQSGRTAESLSVSLEQAGKPIAFGLLRTAQHAEGLAYAADRGPDVLSPQDAVPALSLLHPEIPRFPFWENFERRVLQTDAWERPRKMMPARWLEWFRYAAPVPKDDPFLEAARATILIDTLCWPAAWLADAEERFIAPSLDLTVWFHAPAEGEWLLADARAEIAQAGLIGGHCRIYDEARQLVASGGSQLLCVRAPGK
jgi:acyl-CoA thioesterase